MIRTAQCSPCLWSWGGMKEVSFPCLSPKSLLRLCTPLAAPIFLMELEVWIKMRAGKPSLRGASTFPFKQQKLHPNSGCPQNYGFRIFTLFGGITWIRIPSCLCFLKGINDLAHKKQKNMSRMGRFNLCFRQTSQACLPT